jgi:hypothetical protein
MRQSTFKQSFQKTGKVRSVTGELIVTMNYKSKTVTGTHAVTHDDYSRQISQHKIEMFIDGILWKEVLELDSEAMVENEIKKAKSLIEKEIDSISNSEPVKSFSDKMADLGFA